MDIVEFIRYFIKLGYEKDVLKHFFVPVVGQRKGCNCESFIVKTRDKELNKEIQKICMKHCKHDIEDVNQTCLACLISIIYTSELDNLLTKTEILKMLNFEVSRYYNKKDKEVKVIKKDPKDFEKDIIKTSDKWNNINNHQNVTGDVLREFRKIDLDKYFGRSVRQREIAEMIKQGYRCVDIADKLGISRQAVNYNLRELARKISDKEVGIKKILYYKNNTDIKKTKFQKFMDYVQRKFFDEQIVVFFEKAINSRLQIDEFIYILTKGLLKDDKAVILLKVMVETNFKIDIYLSEVMLQECSKKQYVKSLDDKLLLIIYNNIREYNNKTKEDLNRIREYVRIKNNKS